MHHQRTNTVAIRIPPMAMPALKLEWESTVEERVAKLEANVEHIRSDVTDLRVEVRKLNDKVDAVEVRLTDKIDAVDKKLTAKIDAVDQKLTGKIDTLDQKFTARWEALKDSVSNLALAMEKGFGELRLGRALDRVWYLLMSGALLGIMAKAFKWI